MTWCRRIEEDDRPSIHLYVMPDVEDTAVSLAAAGAEEEGIPLSWGVRDGTAQKLAEEASMTSPLQVGAGIDLNGVAVTFATYRDPGAYLERSFEKRDRAILFRWLGQVAARFVKREPLPVWKGISDESEISEDGIEAIVCQIMEKLNRAEAMHDERT